MSSFDNSNAWDVELEGKHDFLMSMQRIYAWFEGEIIDRPPVRFFAHNSFVNDKHKQRQWKNIRERWFDVEYQVEEYINSIERKKFLGETFPIYCPNLGPNVYAAFYGSELEYDDVTSWAEPIVSDLADVKKLKFNRESEYFKTIEKLTQHALDRCDGKFMVGYTDLHPGLDCVAAWRGTQEFLFDFYDCPQDVKTALDTASNDFLWIFDYFDDMLKAKKQLSSTWMGIPSYGKMHIPSCDFGAMISEKLFAEFYLPLLYNEVKHMTHNIFHLDGKDVARHVDPILDISGIQAIQWVQGVGADQPIMQWVPLIKKIQKAGKSLVLDVQVSELEEFMSTVDKNGIMLCIPSNTEEEQTEILKRIEKW